MRIDAMTTRWVVDVKQITTLACGGLNGAETGSLMIRSGDGGLTAPGSGRISVTKAYLRPTADSQVTTPSGLNATMRGSEAPARSFGCLGYIWIVVKVR